MSDREAFLRRFHAARPGITSAALADTESYDRLIAAVPVDVRVLDLGCADAHLVTRLGPRAIGVDLAPVRTGPPARLVQARAQALPFADGVFGACVCHLAFMLFDPLDPVVAELRRVVVPGGVFAAVLGGGPTAHGSPADDAFHRFLAIAVPSGPSFGDPRARSEAGWRGLFGAAPRFERFELDLGGRFDEVWRFLGASYQLSEADAPAIRDRLRESFVGHARVPCHVVMWLATVQIGPAAPPRRADPLS